MAYLQYFEALEGMTNGIGASVDGQQYQIRRITPKTNGSVLDSAPLGVVLARLTRTTSKALFDNQTFDSLVYIASVNFLPLALGDVLTEGGPQSDKSSYVYAQHRIERKAYWIRTESTVTIRRPADVATRAALGGAPKTPEAGQQEIVGGFKPSIGFQPVAVSGAMEVDEATFDVLTLTNGIYSFKPSASNPIAARVPVGIQPTARAGSPREETLPTDEPGARSSMYVPPLPGVQLQATDEFVVDDGREFLGIQVAPSTVGLVGTVLVVGSVGV